MKIKKMTAHFGALDGDTLELDGGLNILYAPNESGKSTWCAFLRSMLYGVSTSQRTRAGQKPDKLKYRPWSGTPMSGSMDVDTADGPVTIRRWTERDSQPMQAFSATVTGTDLPAWGLDAASAGESLTGMPSEVFERSVFIRQSGLELSNDPELERRINAIVSSGDEEVSFTEAEKRLKAWKRRRSGQRGAIPELRAELDETRRALEAIREQERTAAEMDEQIEALERRRTETERRMTVVRAEQRRGALASMGEARRSVQEAELLCRERENAFRQASEALGASPLGDAEPEEAVRRADEDQKRADELYAAAMRTPSVKRALWPLLPALLALVLAFVLPVRTPLLVLAGVLLIAACASWAFLNRARLRKLRMLEERSAILERYGAERPEDIPEVLEEYQSLWARRERAEARLKASREALEVARDAQKRTEARAMNDLDLVNGDNEAARLAGELESIRTRVGELRERRARAEGQAKALGDPVALESALAEGEGRYMELMRQEEALSLALEELTRADAELQKRLSPLLAKKAAEYFSALTDGRYDEVTLARDLTARTRLAGDDVGRELDYLSAGARDQLYLALRLAVCDLALPGDDPCPIILDDALVTFDGERMALALKLMKKIAADRQVLVFTCHTRESEFFADDEDVAKLTL